MIRYCVDIFVLDLLIYACRKILTEYTNLFSPNNFKKNDSIILNYFMSNI